MNQGRAPFAEGCGPVVQARVDTCKAVAGSSDSDESESEGVTTHADTDDSESDTGMIAAESDEKENGSVGMFDENGENDGSGSEVTTVAEIDEDEIDEGTTFAESGEPFRLLRDEQSLGMVWQNVSKWCERQVLQGPKPS